MPLKILIRVFKESEFRKIFKFTYLAGWKGMLAVQKFRRNLESGRTIPPFIFISVTNNCNLSCRGCWVTPSNPPVDMSSELLERIIESFRAAGSRFFGILGGEPLLHKTILDTISKYPDCYFQVFSNGTTITDANAVAMSKLGNVSPLISIEGLETESDSRRGGKGVYSKAISGLAACRKHKLITGVAASICKNNIDELVNPKFIENLIGLGVIYLWYYIYRPVGGSPCPEIALGEDEILKLRRFIVDARTKYPIIIIDSYWDHLGRALCPAAVGIGYHINPEGFVEPCPPIQFSCDKLDTDSDPLKKISDSEFLAKFRRTASDATRGCILLENPSLLKELVLSENAIDTGGRNKGIEELGNLRPLPGHHVPGKEIPEKNFIYRFAKKHWFFGFGAYG